MIQHSFYFLSCKPFTQYVPLCGRSGVEFRINSVQTQTDGTLGNFRPLEDIFEDAANKIGRSSAESGGKDASIMIPEQDVMHLLQLDCVRAAAHAICETKGTSTFEHSASFTDDCSVELTPDIIVYRYSSDKVLSHLRPKVDRLKQPEVMDRSRTIVRTLAKEGLMDDGKEDLLESKVAYLCQ